MAYTKTTWVAGSAPGVSAPNLNKIEDGIYDAHTLLTVGTFFHDPVTPTAVNKSQYTTHYTFYVSFPTLWTSALLVLDGAVSVQGGDINNDVVKARAYIENVSGSVHTRWSGHNSEVPITSQGTYLKAVVGASITVDMDIFHEVGSSGISYQGCHGTWTLLRVT